MLVSKRSYWLNHQKEVLLPAILILGAFLCGLIGGSLILHTLTPLQLEELRLYLNGFLQGAESYSQVQGVDIWGQVLQVQLGTLGLLWILGLTVVGIPLIILIVAGRGFILGFTVGFLVQEKAGYGLLLAIVAVLPQNLCYVPALLAAGILAYHFSHSLLRGWRENAILSGLLVYSLGFLLILALVLLGAWIETSFVPSLIRFVMSFAIS